MNGSQKLQKKKKIHINHTYTNLLRYKLTNTHGEVLIEI